MKGFLLLILSLMTGCVASFIVKGCQEGWVEFTCNCPKQGGQYNHVLVERQDEILIESTAKDEWKDEGKFSLFQDTEMKTLNVTIKRLKPEDKGVYKCQFKKPNHGKVEVDVTVEKRCQRPLIYKASTKTDITCDYPRNYMSNDVLIYMFFCKENYFTCEDILTTTSSPKSNERFTLKETDSGLTISIGHVSPSDAGVYWCGVQTEHYRAALRQIQLEVKVPPAISTPSVFPSTKSTPTSPSAQNKARRSTLTIIIAVVVCAVLLVLVLILVFIYKRIQHSKYRRNEEAQDNKEDRTYEEIQERPQEPDSGTAIKTIYTTANFHTNPSPDTHYYSNSSFKNSSVEVSAGDPYSTVNDNNQHPTYSTVNHPSGLPDDPCYSTVNNPQQP